MSIQADIDEVERLHADAERYRWLRDYAGNSIMRRLMKECRPDVWDKLVDEAREQDNGT
jgi:hypothetical protein